MMRALRSAAVALSVAAAVIAPGAIRAQTEPTDINVILPLTGGAAFLGQAEQSTLNVLEKQINATGGIHGKPVRFVLLDDASSPQIDVQLMGPLIAKNVPVVLDGGPLATCRAVSPLVMENGPVLYCLSPAFYPPSGGYAFSTGASSEDESRALITFMRNQKWTRVAILTPTDATGQEADRVFKELFALPENRDMRIVAYEHFSPADLSVTAQLTKIKAAQPDVFMAWGTGTPTATEYRAMKDVGLDVPVVGANGNQTYAAMAQWASILPSRYYQYALKWPAYRALRPGPVKSAMATVYKAFAAEGLKPDLGASLTWDPTMIVVSALRALPPGASAQQLRDAILKTSGYAGMNGFYDFRVGNQRGLGLKDCIVVRWDVKAGTWLPVTGSGGAPA
jgi:branched-chain amino acid transport system substrate-binding protein